MNRFKALSIFFVLLLLVSCGLIFEHKYKSYTTSFSETPLPLVDFNTVYDDYNSTLHQVGEFSPLLFSTNRNSEGRQFDFITKFLDITFDYKKNILTVGEAQARQSSVFIEWNADLYQLTQAVNNEADQLGPFLLPRAHKDKGNYQPYVFLYSSNEEGSQDIRFTHNLNTPVYNPTKAIGFLNSTSDDAYPSITQDSSALYFCSNRGGNFDIYSVALDKSKGVVAELESTAPKTVVKETLFSSDSDDKCPFFVGNFMVFTSNRPGGFGGFDLYYSIYKNSAWSAPVNFGDKVNTPADEYRPIVKFMNEYDQNVLLNDFMIFSSNRAGGKGGFDLYYVGIPQIRDNFASEAALGLPSSF